GFHLVAEFDIDENGKVLDFNFSHTRDGGYNKRLEEVLRSFRFRPGTKPDGTPIRMKAQIIYDFLAPPRACAGPSQAGPALLSVRDLGKCRAHDELHGLFFCPPTRPQQDF